MLCLSSVPNKTRPKHVFCFEQTLKMDLQNKKGFQFKHTLKCFAEPGSKWLMCCLQLVLTSVLLF